MTGVSRFSTKRRTPTLPFLLVLLLSAVALGCGGKPSQSGPTPSQSVTISGIPVRSKAGVLTAIDKEVAEKAIKEFQLVPRGDSYFVCYSPGDEVTPLYLLVEMREPVLAIEPTTLSEVDTLNGIEWRGCISLEPKFSRLRDREWEESNGVKDWKDRGGIYLTYTKRGQRWEHDPCLLKEPPANELPK